MKSELTLRDINKLEKFRYYLMEWLGCYDNYDFDTRLSFIAKGFEVFKNNKMNHFDFFAFHKDRIKILTALKWTSHILVISLIMLISSINVFNLILGIGWFLISEVVFSGVSAKNQRYLNEFLKSDNKHFKTLININANDKNEIQKIRDEFFSIEIGTNSDNILPHTLLEHNVITEECSSNSPILINIDDDIISNLYDGLKEYFNKSEHIDLEKVIKGKRIDNQLIFKGNANKLAEVFRRLLIHGKINNNKETIINFLVENFKFKNKFGCFPMNENTVKATMTWKQVFSSNNTIKIIGLDFVKKR